MLKYFIKNLWPACRTVFTVAGISLGCAALFFGLILFIAWARIWAIIPLPFLAVGIIAYARAKEDYNREKHLLEYRIENVCETYRSACASQYYDEATKIMERARAYIDEYEVKYGRKDGIAKQYSSHLDNIKQIYRREE